MFGIPLPGFAQPYALVIKIVLILIAVAAVAYALHVFFEHYREQGRSEVRKEYSALVAKCAALKQNPDKCAESWTQVEANNATLSANNVQLKFALKEQTDQVDRWIDAGKTAKAATARLLAELAKRQKENAAYIAGLRVAVASPAPKSKEKECEEADAISVDAADRRVRYFANSPASPKGGGNHGADPSAGSLRISR